MKFPSTQGVPPVQSARLSGSSLKPIYAEWSGVECLPQAISLSQRFVWQVACGWWQHLRLEATFLQWSVDYVVTAPETSRLPVEPHTHIEAHKKGNQTSSSSSESESRVAPVAIK